MRASAVRNCQSIFTFARFRSRSHALVRVDNDSRSGTRPPMLCFSSTASSTSATFSQLPCLGVWTISSFSINRRASVGSNASYRLAAPCVFRLSITSVIFSARL